MGNKRIIFPVTKFAANIDKLIHAFLKPGEKISDGSFEKTRNINKLYRLFRDLTIDIRATKVDALVVLILQ